MLHTAPVACLCKTLIGVTGWKPRQHSNNTATTADMHYKRDITAEKSFTSIVAIFEEPNRLF
jgi:hypothetical protein